MDLADQEREKYQFVWSHGSYRHSSPGEISAHHAIDYFNDSGTVNDYGAGTGRASVKFKEAGYDPLCIDIANNSQDSGIPFFEACLWDMDAPIADYGYCCDVMEHIPPEKVDAVLDNIRKHTRKKVYFQIAHFPDEWYGEKLHLTVMPPTWWARQLSKYFIIEKEDMPRPERTGYYCVPLKNINIDSHINTDVVDILENIKVNSARGLPELQEGEAKSSPVAIVGGGPSLNETWPALKNFRVVSTNGAHDFLIEKGIKPYAHVMCDSQPECVEFVRNPQKEVKYLISDTCHPSVFDALNGYDVTIWHSFLDLGEPEDVLRVAGGSTVGMRSINLFAVQGYLAFFLFGMDSCYGEGHHAYDQPMNDGEYTHKVVADGREFKCATWMIQQAEDFKKFIQNFGNTYKIYVVGDGLLSAIVGAK